jgi:hypothetical protein
MALLRRKLVGRQNAYILTRVGYAMLAGNLSASALAFPLRGGTVQAGLRSIEFASRRYL